MISRDGKNERIMMRTVVVLLYYVECSQCCTSKYLHSATACKPVLYQTADPPLAPITPLSSSPMVPCRSISAPFCCWSVPGTTLLWEKFVFIQTTTFLILPFFHHSRYPFLISFIFVCISYLGWSLIHLSFSSFPCDIPWLHPRLPSPLPPPRHPSCFSSVLSIRRPLCF